jgi:hypothetical protein
VIRYALWFVATSALAQPCENPVIPQAKDRAALVQAEHDWLRTAYGGGTLVRQVLGASSDGRRRYDVITWRKPDGETVDVCFDVTTVFEETIREIEKEEEGAARRPAR